MTQPPEESLFRGSYHLLTHSSFFVSSALDAIFTRKNSGEQCTDANPLRQENCC